MDFNFFALESQAPIIHFSQLDASAWPDENSFGNFDFDANDLSQYLNLEADLDSGSGHMGSLMPDRGFFGEPQVSNFLNNATDASGNILYVSYFILLSHMFVVKRKC
ncbi:hypothetical protein NX059_005107 [Plenodomus lindquistii]|nr:hypothetical protein NX059_005107 [Plenodomus lindquistii]